MKKIVDGTRLNFRSQPEFGDNTIGVLHLGQAVDVTGSSPNNSRFVPVDAEVGGATLSGFASERFSRDPESDEREALISEAVAEWKRFAFGLGKEHHDPFFEFVGEMWESIGLNLDGRDRDTPWSAAAISFMVRNAGHAVGGTKYPKFKFAAAHSRYVNDSIGGEKGPWSVTEAPVLYRTDA